MAWSTADIPDLTGKVCVVTGANTGLGLSDARVLAGKGATVVMACRNLEKANRAAQDIREKVPGSDVRVAALDLSSLTSVRKFAASFLAENDRLDLLINNAGVMIPPRTMTEDGFELQFATNHLGHFLLTGLLLPLLEKTPGARVVSLSSVAHRFGRIDLANLNAERSYSRIGAYAQSKLACLMFGLELHRRLQRSGSHVVSVAAHPGATRTELGRHDSFISIGFVLAQSVDDGAMPTLRAATDPAVKGGEYYGPANWFGARGPAVLETPRKQARDKEVASQLWQASEKLAAITYL